MYNTNVDIRHLLAFIFITNKKEMYTMKNIDAVSTQEAPQAIGPYSQGIISGGFLFISGQLPIDPETGTLIDGDIKLRTPSGFQKHSGDFKNCGQQPE